MGFMGCAPFMRVYMVYGHVVYRRWRGVYGLRPVYSRWRGVYGVYGLRPVYEGLFVHKFCQLSKVDKITRLPCYVVYRRCVAFIGPLMESKNRFNRKIGSIEKSKNRLNRTIGSIEQSAQSNNRLNRTIGSIVQSTQSYNRKIVQSAQSSNRHNRKIAQST
jgi:hypothetical protein